MLGSPVFQNDLRHGVPVLFSEPRKLTALFYFNMGREAGHICTLWGSAYKH